MPHLVETGGPAGRQRALVRLVDLAFGEGRTAVPWLVVAAVLVYLGFFIGRFDALLSAMHWSSDAAFWQVLARDPPRPGSSTNLGNTPHYAAIGFLMATRGVPGRQVLWDVTPVLTSVVAVLLIAWAARRAFGGRAAILALCIGIAPSYPVLLTILPHGFRVWTWLANAALGAVLILVCDALGGPARRTRRLICGAALAGAALFSGITAASDPLFLATGLLPLLIAAGAVAVVRRDRTGGLVALSAVAIVAGAAATAVVLTGVMRGAGFISTNPSFAVAELDQVARNIVLLGEAMLGMGNGLFFERRIGPVAVVMAVSGLMACAAIVAMLVAAARAVARRSARTAPSGAVRTAFVAYWASAAVLVIGAWVLSTIPVDGLASSRYVVPVFYSAVALVALSGTRVRRRRMLVVGAVALFCFTGVFGQDTLLASGAGNAYRTRGVIRFLERAHLRRGYAGYWESHAFTWQTGGRSRVYPVFECDPPRTLCPFMLAVNTRWFEPEPGTRTFIVTRSTGPLPRLLNPPPPGLGPPADSATFGEYAVYVYDYDIATRFGPMPDR